MKILRLGILLSILYLWSCPKDPVINREILLIGNWEAYEQTNLRTGQTIIGEPGIMLGQYCSAFELRHNNEYAIYYHIGGTSQPEYQLSHGNWRLEENKKLIFELDSYETIVEIIELTEDHLIMEQHFVFRIPTQFKLKRN